MSITYGNSYISGLNTFDLNIDYISTLQGTSNQVAVNGDFTNPKTGSLQLSLPQNINIDNDVSFNSLKLYDVNTSNAWILDSDTGVIGFYKGGSTIPSFTFSNDKFTTSRLKITNGASNGRVLVSDANGDATWSSTYIKSITGTTNQVNVSNVSGDITLSTPQNIHTGASPTFYGITLTNGGTTQRVLCSDSYGNGFWNAIDGITINGTANQIDKSTFNGTTTLSLPTYISKTGSDPSFILINNNVASSLRLALAGGVNYIQSGTDGSSGVKPLAITSMFAGYEWMRFLTTGEVETTKLIPKIDSFYGLGDSNRRWSSINAVNGYYSYLYTPLLQITDINGAQWQIRQGNYRLNFFKQNETSPYNFPTNATNYFYNADGLGGLYTSELGFTYNNRNDRLFKSANDIFMDYADGDMYFRKINPNTSSVQHTPIVLTHAGGCEIQKLRLTGEMDALSQNIVNVNVISGSTSNFTNMTANSTLNVGGSLYCNNIQGYLGSELDFNSMTLKNISAIKGSNINMNNYGLYNLSFIQGYNGTVKDPTFYFEPTSVGMYYDSTNSHISFTNSNSKRLGIGTNGINNIDGSASSPSITFLNDTNTGIYRKGNDNIGISTNGSEVFNVDTTLNFTTNGADIPSTLTKSVGTRIVLYPQLSATDSNYSIGIAPNELWMNTATTTGSIKFYNSTALRARINSSGVNTDYITSLGGSYIGFDNKKLENINTVKFSTTNQTELGYYEEWNGTIKFTKQTSGDYNRLASDVNLPVRITRIGRMVNMYFDNPVNSFNVNALCYFQSDTAQIPDRFRQYNTGYSVYIQQILMNDAGTVRVGLISLWTSGQVWFSSGSSTDTGSKFSGVGYNGPYSVSVSYSI